MYFVAGVFLLACMDTTTKYLTAYYPPPLVVAVRYVVHCLLMVILLAPTAGSRLVQTRRTGMVLIRAACLAAASLLLALALKRMPIAEASSIVFLGPILVVVMAGPILHENIGMVGWVAAIAGFTGVLFIARPGAGLDTVGVSLAFSTAVVTAIYQLLSRVLARSESTLAMLFYTAVVGAVLFGACAPWFWGGERPTLLHVILFLAIGALAGIGHFLFTAAHRVAPASMLAPLQYVQILFAGVLGWVVFGHVPDAFSILGMCLVVVAGAAVAIKSRMAEP
jgi:drug/metabolite transporter (DMT)-like permease